MVDVTVSDVYAGKETGGPRLRRRTALYVVLRASAPFEPSARHLLDDIDVVRFGRGERAARRDRHEGLRRLTLRLPDPVISGDHGRLLFANGQWRFEDPRSKNGAILAGTATRCAVMQPGDVLQLGHTLFLLETRDLPEGLPLDVVADGLEPATLHAGLAHDLSLLRRVAAADVPVLLLGESGTGKEIVARGFHDRSRRSGPFVAVNCGGLGPTLIEAELFGHRRGAFSGAVADRPGYLRAADGGTLFLDEVGDLPVSAQATLLRALQERAVVAVGDSAPVPVNLRVVAATNRDLTAAVADGRFREDLYARLVGLTVTLPPLRERRCDLGLLVAALLRRLAGGTGATLVPAAACALLSHSWPRNVRELEHCLATALALAGGAPIEIAHLPPAVVGQAPAERAPAPPAQGDEDATLARDVLVEALTRHRGNISAVARDLGKHREQIHRLARRLGIDLESFRR